jgi:hypothetical protein
MAQRDQHPILDSDGLAQSELKGKRASASVAAVQ